ncbi:MAG: trigger factor [Sphingobacteriales bacterium]|nr:MAG: trigger factor [Sphingobacteriales bacterium]
MATVTRENLGTLHDKITVKLAKEDYMPSFEKSLKHYAKSANVPGFRKGMVPAGMVRKMYGQSLFSDEVVRTASSKLEEYLKSEQLAIFAQPMIMRNDQPIRLDMNAPEEVDFAFEVGLKPEFNIEAVDSKTTLPKYKVAVADKMVEDEVERIKRRYGKAEDQDAVSNKDNIVYAKYEMCDADGNVAADPQMVEDTALLEKYPAKLQDMLMGKKAEDTLVIRPADICTEEELAGFMKDPLKKTTEEANEYYKLTLTKVAQLIPSELNAELFAQVFPNTEVKDEAEFKALIKQELGKEYNRISNERLQNEMYELLVHNTKLNLPVNFLKRWMKEGGEQAKSEAEVEKEFPGFDHQLRWTLISDKLIQDNNINVTREDVMEDIKTRVLAYFGMPSEEDATWLDSYMAKVMKDDKTVDETYRRLLFDKLFQTLESKFNIEEKEVAEEEFFKLPDAHAAHHHQH